MPSKIEACGVGLASNGTAILVIVTGAPCSGKTTLAARIAENVGLPPITKDTVKESVFDTMDWNDRERSRRVGYASLIALFDLIEVRLGAGRPVVAENACLSRYLPTQHVYLPASPARCQITLGGYLMAIPLNEIVTMPAYSPYYPMPPARYRDVRIQQVFFRADLSAIDRILPECFEPSEDGLCVAKGLSVGWCSSYGAFLESALSVSCTYQGQKGSFAPVAYLDSRSSIPAGREIYGTPKVFADMRVEMDERAMYTESRLAGTSALTIRSTMHREADLEEIPGEGPSWWLKVIPKASGDGVDVMQIIDGSNVVSDSKVHVCRAGDGVVEFNPVPTFDLSDFKPLEYYGAYYQELEFTEGYAEIVHDFLTD